MSVNFKLNTYYKYSSQVDAVSICEFTHENKDDFIQLSLFSDQAFKPQQINFSQLLHSFEDNLYFILREDNQKLVWHCFLSEESINPFINNKIKSSAFDYVIWPKNQQQPPKLIVFDMDSTFIQIEVIDELAKVHNVGEQVSRVTESAMRGELDFSESLITRVACLEGLDSDTIEQIANQLPLSLGIEELVTWAHSKAIKIAIVSGGFTPFVEKLKNEMSLYKVKANNLEVYDQQLTGKVIGKIVDAQAKADFINELKQDLNLESNEIMAVGDGANDLVMMQETGFSLAYKAKPAVDEQAKGRMKKTDFTHLTSVFRNSF